jgi:hypothetical protein
MACDFVKVNRDKVSTGIAIIGIIFILSLTYPNTQAQTNISFTPADKFTIPAYNGSIGFAVNGTYSKATFENNTWTFTNLYLNGSQLLENFQLSTQNSNLTIFSYQAINVTTFQIVLLSYAVEGKGEQVLNLGLGPEENGLDPSVEWNVIVHNNVFLAEGVGWNISNNGTMIVNGASGNVSIVHYDFGNSAPSSNLPFYEQHSIVIIVAVGVVATVIVAGVIRVRSRKHSGENELVKVVR